MAPDHRSSTSTHLTTEDPARLSEAQEPLQGEDFFRHLLESAPDAMVITNRDGRIEMINEQTERLFGYERHELIGQPVEFLMPPRESGAPARPHQGLSEETRDRPMGAGNDLVLQRKNGSRFPAEISLSRLSPLETNHGFLISAAVRNVAQQVETREQLKARTEALEHANAELEQFAYVASHDLQEPLRMVASYTELLAQSLKGQLDEKCEKYVAYIVDGAKRMQQLIDHLLAYSRLDNSPEPVKAVQLDAVLDHVLGTLDRAIDGCGARVERGDMPVVLGERSQLELVFRQLLENALRFKSEREPEVRILAQRREDDWLLSVQDNGIGIDMQFSERIFNLFQRLHERGKYPGAGAGLTLARRVVERHGGRIWVESKPGEGATFYFNLRAAESD